MVRMKIYLVALTLVFVACDSGSASDEELVCPCEITIKYRGTTPRVYPAIVILDQSLDMDIKTIPWDTTFTLQETGFVYAHGKIFEEGHSLQIQILVNGELKRNAEVSHGRNSIATSIGGQAVRQIQYQVIGFHEVGKLVMSTPGGQIQRSLPVSIDTTISVEPGFLAKIEVESDDTDDLGSACITGRILYEPIPGVPFPLSIGQRCSFESGTLVVAAEVPGP